MMKKQLKKIVSGIICLTVMASATLMTACGGGINANSGVDFYEDVDPTRTQLYIGNYNGGFGFEWLEKAKKRFEAIHSDVQIMIDNGKEDYEYEKLAQNIATNRQDIYVLDYTDYYRYINEGLVLDITDTVKDGGANSIANRMNEDMRHYYETPDGKFYGVPFYQIFYSLNYDVDLFDEYLLWLNYDGTDFVSSLDEPRYPGLKGEEGTWDAGLPRTYSQFFKLLDKMVEYGITPVTGTGLNKDWYYNQFLFTVFADYMGNEFDVNLNYNGTEKTIENIETLVEPAAGTFSLPASAYGTATVTMSNYTTTLTKQAGKYYAIKFASDLVGSGYKYVKQDKFNSPAETHTGAQSTFLRSRYKNEPIAMLIEGGFWYNEAKVTMEEMAREYGDEWHWKNRRFGIMPIPKADDGSSADGRTVSSAASSMIAISPYSQKVELAKEFFKFIHTDESLREFSMTTLTKRPFKYTLTDSEISTLPYFSQNLFEATEDMRVIPLLPQAEELFPYFSNVSGTASFFKSVVGNNQFTNPLVAFFEEKGLTVNQYFKGLQYKANN